MPSFSVGPNRQTLRYFEREIQAALPCRKEKCFRLDCQVAAACVATSTDRVQENATRDRCLSLQYDVEMNTNSPSDRSARGAFGLSGKYVNSADIFERESNCIFSQNWICVGRVEQLNTASDCLPIEFENHRLIVMRDEQGIIRAFRNFCRHRGSQLVTQQNCEKHGKRIQCPYHAWTYDRSGALTSAPNMENVPEFQRSEHGLIEVDCQTKGGFLWINLATNPASTQWLDPLADRMADWRVEELRIGAEIEYEVNANWKLIFQNYSECYHCPIVHPMLNRLTPYRGSSNDLDQGAILGGPMNLAEDSQTMSTDGKLVAPVIQGLSSNQSRSVHYFTVFPTLFLSLHPDYVLIHLLQRIDVGKTRVSCQFLFEPESINTNGFDPNPAVEFWDLTNRQDWEVCELAQSGMSQPGYVPGPYSNLESVLAAFDRHYLDLMA